MTIIATGNTSILKPDCPCCEPCPCHVILDYAIAGLSKDVCDEAPTLCFTDPDCHGNTVCGQGIAESTFFANMSLGISTDIFVTLTHPVTGIWYNALFLRWEITFPFVPYNDPEQQQANESYDTSIRQPHVTLTSPPCGFVAIAVYHCPDWPTADNYGLYVYPVSGKMFTGVSPSDPSDCLYYTWNEYARFSPPGYAQPDPKVTHWYHSINNGGPTRVHIAFRSSTFTYEKAWGMPMQPPYYPWCSQLVDCGITIQGMRWAQSEGVPGWQWVCTHTRSITINCADVTLWHNHHVERHYYSQGWANPICYFNWPPYTEDDCNW